MKKFLREFSVAVAGGLVAGLICAVAAWAAGRYGLSARIGLNYRPALGIGLLLHYQAWGAAWGLLLLLPVAPGSALLRGLLAALPPAAVQLFWVLPQIQHRGFLGQKYGELMWALVLGLNLLWGLVASGWQRLLR